MRNPLEKLMEQEVVVVASGIRYRGVLKEVTEERVCLQARTGWREIPMDRVTEVRSAADEGRKSLERPFLDWRKF